MKKFTVIACIICWTFFAIKPTFATDIFTVKSIIIEESSASSADAKSIGIAKAKQEALSSILKKILTSSDFKSITKTELDSKVIESLIAGVQISNEQTSSTKYKAKMNISFGLPLLGEFLKNKGYKFITDTPANTLLIPFVIDDANEISFSATDNLIRSLNNKKSTPENIIPVQIPSITSKNVFTIALQKDAEKISALNDMYNSTSIIIAKISHPSKESAKLDVIKYDTGTSDYFTIQLIDSENIYDTLSNTIIQVSNDIYKKDLINNKGASGELTAVFTIKSISDVLQIEKTLSEIKSITNIFTKAISPQMVQITLKTKTNKKTIIQALSSKGFSVKDMNTYIIVKPLI